MTANNQTQRSVRFRIKRQDTPQQQAYWEDFDLQYRPNLNVISCLQMIALNPVTTDGRHVAPVVWDSNCLEEVCGACTVVINGRARQACSTLVDHLINDEGTGTADQPILLEPMTKFPVVRDLWVDRQRMFDNLKKLKGWVPIDGSHDLGAGPVESPDQQDERYMLSRCMTCGCCLEACPQFTLDNNFIGAQAIGQALYFNLHETGKALADDRLERLESSGGISDCGNAQNCVKVCPKEIPLTEAIGKMGREVTFHTIRTFFSGKK